MVKLAKLLGAFVMVNLYFFGCDLLTEAFPGGSGAEVVAMLATGPLAPYFWTEIAGCAALRRHLLRAGAAHQHLAGRSARCSRSSASSASACSCSSAASRSPTWTTPAP